MKDVKSEFVFLRWKFLQKKFSLHFYCVLILCLAIEVVFYNHIVYCSIYHTISSCKLNIHTYIHRAQKEKKRSNIYTVLVSFLIHDWLITFPTCQDDYLPSVNPMKQTNKQIFANLNLLFCPRKLKIPIFQIRKVNTQKKKINQYYRLVYIAKIGQFMSSFKWTHLQPKKQNKISQKHLFIARILVIFSILFSKFL